MNFDAAFERIRNWWSTTDKTQRTVTIAGAVVLVALLAGTAWFASRPKMEPIFPGANPAEQGIVRDAVQGYGFPTDINPRGDVMVPFDRIPEIRMRLSQEGKLPSTAIGTVGGQADAATGGLFQTPAELTQQLRNKQEAELAKSIGTMTGVQTAIVHINFGKDSPFGDQKIAPTAVVNIAEKAGYVMEESEGKAIARLVQNAVPGLEAKNVSVLSTTRGIIWDGEALNSDENLSNRKLEAEREEGRRRERELQRRLDLAFGPGTTSVMVAVELNMDEVESKQESETPTDSPLARESMSEELRGGGSRLGGEAGLEANLPGQPAATGENNDADNNYRTETSRERFGTDRRNVVTRKAPGELSTMNINVLVDSAKVEDVAAVRSFVEGFIATAAVDGRNFTAQVTQTTFSTAAAEKARLEAGAAANSRLWQQLLALLPILALVAVGMMIVRTLAKAQERTVEAARIAAGVDPALEGPTRLSLPGARTEVAIEDNPNKVTVRRQGHEREIVIDGTPEYDLSQLDDIDPNDFLLNPGVQQSSPQARQELADILASSPMSHFDEDDPQDQVEIGGIAEKVDVPLEQIRKLARDKPETVAMMLKTWMTTER
ncbi:MAG: hypothetical protein MH204_05560 [Fimbriimonadaceae bacterium]|nr:hypothetical protein [Fimbriimonadaceae bacterium]